MCLRAVCSAGMCAARSVFALSSCWCLPIMKPWCSQLRLRRWVGPDVDVCAGQKKLAGLNCDCRSDLLSEQVNENE